MLDERPTTPPNHRDDQARAFEREVEVLGESTARWNRLLSLLEGTDDETQI